MRGEVSLGLLGEVFLHREEELPLTELAAPLSPTMWEHRMPGAPALMEPGGEGQQAARDKVGALTSWG